MDGNLLGRSSPSRAITYIKIQSCSTYRVGMAGGFLLSLMRLLGLISPTELRAMGHTSPSSVTHTVHNFLILAAIGGSLAYGELATYEETTQKYKGKMVAYIVMTGLAKTWGIFAFFFLVIRNIILHRHYSSLAAILNAAINFEIDRFREEKQFKFFISVFLLFLFCIRLLFVVNNHLEDSAGTLWGLLDSISYVLSNIYLMLFATKLVFLTRIVRFNFQVANRFLKRNIMKRQKKSCEAPRDELDVLLKLQWKAYGFLEVINVTFGTELAVVMMYIYLGILRNLYYASIASALFSAEDPDIPTLAVNLCQAVQELVMSIVILGNGGVLTEEVKNTQVLVWNAVHNVYCVNTRRKLLSFITLVSYLPSDLTAKGIFKLNMKTFCNIITSVATQLVILISMGNQ